MNGYGTATISTFTRNEKNFELCNHVGKWADDYKIHKRPTPQVPADWRPIIYPHRPPAETEPELGPPYGDNPVDNDWIKR